MRPLRPAEIEAMEQGVAHYVENARHHAAAIREALA
jgi:hypothetical protein